ncbi:hypothetical protein, partial [Pseudokineococcus marinus]|uniref:hypothetical protein n=1 Tax=Pseudokineococcus marinus TaxID=351215 RepID=UPI0031DA9AAD
MALPPGTPAADGRPLLVVAGSPGLLDVDHALLPADAVVLRCGPLEDEGDLLLGRRVDLWAPPPGALASGAVAAALAAGRHAVGALARTDDDGAWDGAERLPVPVLDVRDVLAQHPWAARRALGAPPGPLLSLVLLAAVAGFTDVRVLDLRGERTSSGRPWVSEDTTAADELDQAELDRDLAALEALPGAFPGLVVAAVGPARPLRRFAPAATAVAPGRRLAPAAPAPLWAERPGPDGAVRRVAFVTTCDSPEYLWGVRALAASLAATTDVPLLVLVPPSLDLAAHPVEAPGVRFVRAPRIANPRHEDRHARRFLHTYTKLAVFGLGFLDRAVFLDADTVVLRAVDDLLDGAGFAAAPDMGVELHRDAFNTGVFGFTPDPELLARLLEAAPSAEAPDGSDQGFLNGLPAGVLGEVRWLDRRDNTLRRVRSHHSPLFDLDEVRVLHYVGEKPWATRGADPWGPLDELWFTHLSPADRLRWERRARGEVREAHRRLADLEREGRPGTAPSPPPTPRAAEAERLLAEGDAAAA